MPIRLKPGRSRLARWPGLREPRLHDRPRGCVGPGAPGEVLGEAGPASAGPPQPLAEIGVTEDVLAEHRGCVTARRAGQPRVDSERPQPVGGADVVDDGDERSLALRETRRARRAGEEKREEDRDQNRANLLHKHSGLPCRPDRTPPIPRKGDLC